MDHERWQRATMLFHSALEQEPEERPAFLDHACGSDIDLRHDIELLLAREPDAGSFMEIPAAHRLIPPRALSLLGRQFGPYRIVSQLGAGGMGEVYCAHDSKLGRDVALKTLPAEFTDDAERLARFRREARTLASLNHPNIAAIYGLEESGDLGRGNRRGPRHHASSRQARLANRQDLAIRRSDRAITLAKRRPCRDTRQLSSVITLNKIFERVHTEVCEFGSGACCEEAR